MLMSRDNKGNKQTIILHNWLFKEARDDLVITPHRQHVRYIGSKQQKKDDNNLKAEADDEIVFFAEHETLFWNLSQQNAKNSFIKSKRINN